MSFWRLEQKNLSDALWLPTAGFSTMSRAHWNDIIGFHKFTLWLINILALPFLAVAGAGGPFIAELAGRALIQRKPDFLQMLLLTLLGVWLTCLAVLMVRDMVRLTILLMHGKRVA